MINNRKDSKLTSTKLRYDSMVKLSYHLVITKLHCTSHVENCYICCPLTQDNLFIFHVALCGGLGRGTTGGVGRVTDFVISNR